MAVLLLDTQLSVFGNGEDHAGPVSYNERWHVNNVILDLNPPGSTVPDIAVYRAFVAPGNLVLRSEASDVLNKTVNVDVYLYAGEPLFMVVSGADANSITTAHLMGDRHMAMAGYPDTVWNFGR